MCRYPWFTLSWYSTPTYQRCFQRSHHHLGKWLYQGHSFWLRSQEDSRWYWPLVSLSHLLESTYLLTKFHLHCHLLVSTTFCKAKALCSGQVTTQKHWWRYACRYFCPVFTETWIMHRFICWLFKAMYLIKWSRLFKLSLNFVILSNVMYMMTKASACYRMLSIVSTNTARYSEWLVFIPMALTSLNPIPLSTTCISFKHLVLQMASTHQSQNLNIL